LGKIPPLKRFRSEDYPSLPDNFLSNLSTAIETIINTLDNFVNFDNISGQLFERVNIKKDDLAVSASNPIRLSWTKKYPPVAVVVGGLWVKNNDLNSAILGYNITIEWDFDSKNNQVVIRGVNGLATSGSPLRYAQNFQITLLAFCR
jgi:hypothetical protein